ncbi:hypothetical protein PSHT_14552 [Puccinia striiformis]|uniref:Uncharacterized protein n=1 Tax=Puccinia striiformis TaxID=27350 RepID=A0A2S4UJQ4_9BASI|nr:hypothetical protein PSHT_14552 [Puccinia striiformis]
MSNCEIIGEIIAVRSEEGQIKISPSFGLSRSMLVKGLKCMNETILQIHLILSMSATYIEKRRATAGVPPGSSRLFGHIMTSKLPRFLVVRLTQQTPSQQQEKVPEQEFS